MRFLRMLTNSLLAGALGAAYLTVIVLQLNPHVPIVSAATWRWFLSFGVLYGLHLAVIFYVAMMVREFFSFDAMSPGWASVRVLAWLSAIVAALASLVMWLNVDGFWAVLDEVAQRRMTLGAGAMTASAVVLLGVAIAHYSWGRRGSRVGAALFALAAIGSLALPLAARGRAVDPPAYAIPPYVDRGPRQSVSPRVTMLVLDGASIDYISARIAEGRLPNFGKLIETGAWMDLATIRPTQPATVYTAIASGMYPTKNGVRSAASYFALNSGRPIDLLPDHCLSHALVHLGIARDAPLASDAWRTRPLWHILGEAGIASGIVQWPLTYPVHPVRGFLVSDRFQDLLGSMFEIDNRIAYPPDVVSVARGAFGEGTDPDATADLRYSRVMVDLRARWDVQVTALRYKGLDIAGHRYLFMPSNLGRRGDSEPERREAMQVLDRAYGFVDSEIGTAIESLAPGDLLLVVSGFGMERLNPLKQMLGRIFGDTHTSGAHDRAPDGFLLAYGTSVARGRHQRGSIVDVTPTVLYFLGLPVGRDMDGYARADLFTREFSAERPIAYIPTYNR
jgi:hypothetical protein